MLRLELYEHNGNITNKVIHGFNYDHKTRVMYIYAVGGDVVGDVDVTEYKSVIIRDHGQVILRW